MQLLSEDTDILVFTDHETTGLVAHKEHLLEVACLVTDLELNLLDEAGFHRTVFYTDERAQQLRADADEVPRRMHDASGLWGRLPSGTPIETLDDDLLAYVQRFAPRPRQARFAGSSLRLDMNFTDQWLPRTAAHMHYRFVDISGLAYLANEWAGVPYFPKARNHTAMEDILESLAELRYLRDQGMFRAPVAP